MWMYSSETEFRKWEMIKHIVIDKDINDKINTSVEIIQMVIGC